MSHYCIFVHGIGEQAAGAYDDFTDKLLRSIPCLAKIELAYWAFITQPDEERLKNMVNKGGLLYDFMIGSFGDLVAYSKLPNPPDRYSAIQFCFREAVYDISKLARWLHDTDAKLSVIGHSLGSVIASDGLYDLIKTGQMPPNLTLQGFFTMGSPLALYGLRYGLDNFNKPIRPKAWLNFYYPQDIAAFPLKKLNAAYNAAVTADVCLSPPTFGKRLIGFLPLVGIKSHSWYFTDQRVIEEIALAITK